MPRSVLHTIEALHRRIVRLERLRLVAGLALTVSCAVTLAIVVDAGMRWPWFIRAALLVVGLVAAIRLVRAVIDRGWLRAPGAGSVAVRLEQVEPSLAGRLAAAFDFERTGTHRSSALAAAVVGDVANQLESVRVQRHVRMSRSLAFTATAATALAAWVAVALVAPEMVRVGLCRTLTPWTSDQWPARVALQVQSLPAEVGRGSSIELRAQVTRGDQPDLRVRVDCTVHGASSGERLFELARQPDGSFTRPVIAEGDRMTIRITADDAETDAMEILVRTPPSIVRGEVEITPPAYAAAQRPALRGAWQGTAASDPGVVLAGSQASVALDLAADAVTPGVGQTRARWVPDTGGTSRDVAVVAETPRRWKTTFTVEEPGHLEVLPVDAHGVAASEPLRLALRVVADGEPAVSVTQPEADETVTLQASVPFRVEARDDIALDRVGWRVDRQQRSGEPAPVLMAQANQPILGHDGQVQGTLDLSLMQAKVGDTLQLRGVASDRFERSGERRAETRSEPRRLRVVEREALERQAREQAATIREAAARLATAQREITADPVDSTATRSQAGLADRVRETTQSTRRLAQRLQRNGLQEGALADALRDVAALGEQAEQRARAAQDALQRSSQGDATGREAAKASQSESRDLLQAMVDRLDQDDDSAGAQRRADRLVQTIKGLREELRKASQSSMGKTPEDMTTAERKSMQEQSARQRAAAEEAAAMIDDLRARAERLQGKDRSQASSLQQAAEEGERGQASRRLDEAAERTDRNQASAADEAMQAAEQAAERVQGALRDDRRARTEDLKRRLASLSETLQALIRQGEEGVRKVDALATAPLQVVEPVAVTLVRLGRNTAGAAEEARQAGGVAQKAIGPINRAVERIDASVTSLRAQPVQHERAREALARGVDLLREALQAVKQAQREQQARQKQQERAQLAAQYRRLATDVRTVREATAATIPADGARIDRRGAAIQREQASRVAVIEKAFADGPLKDESLRGAATFQSLHERLTRDLAATRTTLESSNGDAATVRRLDIVAEGFEALAVALSDAEAQEDPFADGKQQDEGQAGTGEMGGDGAQALPPIAELKLVRQMQQQVNRLTVALDAARVAGQKVDREMQDLGQMQEEVRRLGDDWIQRMQERQQRSRQPGEAKPADASATPSMPLSFLQANQAQPPEATPPTSVPPTAPATKDAPKTLDELLGIAGDAGDVAAEAQRKRKLERSLRQEDLDDLAKAATESMQVATDLLRARGDSGIGTQRVQAEALAHLDALLDAATRMQRQQQASRSSSSSKPSGKPQQGKDQAQSDSDGSQPQPGQEASKQASAGERSRNRGNAGDQVEPPTMGDEAASGALLEGRAEWGHLPPRIREIMSQARRDAISAVYQQATEAYYRRMAEDRKP